MSNLHPIADPDKIAAAIMASDALGLAGSSAMSGGLRISFAKELVMRINAATAAIDRLSNKVRLTGNDLTPAEDRLWSAYADQIDTCRGTLQTLIADVLGVCPEDLVRAL